MENIEKMHFIWQNISISEVHSYSPTTNMDYWIYPLPQAEKALQAHH
jgi:hypothetical protein